MSFKVLTRFVYKLFLFCGSKFHSWVQTTYVHLISFLKYQASAGWDELVQAGSTRIVAL